MDLRARDLWNVPGCLSLCRVVLALLFPAIAHAPPLAVAVVAAAGATDALDGWLARRLGQTTTTGAVLDPVADKLFVLSVVVTLLMRGELSPLQVLLLASRDVLELPLALWLGGSGRTRAARERSLSANRFGKANTFLQFIALLLVLLQHPHAQGFIVATAVTGAIAAGSYWLRAVRAPPTAG